MDARLKIVNGPSSGEIIAISPGKLIVGREQDCHLRPASEFISRHHCVFLLDSCALRLRDLGSKNGTFVNGRRIASGEIVLLCDDMVSIGELVFQVEFQPAALENGAPAALQGTRIMDGETLSSQPPKPATPTISEATNSAALPARVDATFE
jgi:pSer/pThr/pTyr-binding forkhead associated (FHA) protein